MKHSNSQDSKLKIIEQLIILNDDNVFKKVEDIINNSLHRPKPDRFSKQDLLDRAKSANKNIEENEVYSQSSVEKNIKSW